MPARRQSLGDYAYDRLEQFHRTGAIVEQLGTIYIGEDWRLIIQGLLLFGQDQQAQLWVYEVVERNDETPSRVKYTYNLGYEGGLAFRYDRDPNHADMVEHKHLPPDGRRIAWGRVTFQEVIDECVAIVAEREEPGAPTA